MFLLSTRYRRVRGERAEALCWWRRPLCQHERRTFLSDDNVSFWIRQSVADRQRRFIPTQVNSHSLLIASPWRCLDYHEPGMIDSIIEIKPRENLSEKTSLLKLIMRRTIVQFRLHQPSCWPSVSVGSSNRNFRSLQKEYSEQRMDGMVYVTDET